MVHTITISGNNNTWKKMLLQFALSGLIFFAFTMPFRQYFALMEVTEIRPAAALPPFFGMVYGFWGALGCAVANMKTIAQNKKARHDYFVEETYEAGIELCGTEVKSLRAGRVNLKDSWCSIVDGEIFVNGMHISPYEQGNIFNRDPMRVRKLLMHKKEILKLYGTVKQTGYSLIPISLYFKDSKVKLQVGLCKGKKLYDKRADMAERSAKRDMERAIKEQRR